MASIVRHDNIRHYLFATPATLQMHRGQGNYKYQNDRADSSWLKIVICPTGSSQTQPRVRLSVTH